MQRSLILGAVILAIGLAGCTRSTDALRVNTQAPPQPLPSTPSGSFESSQLQPADPQQYDPNAAQNAPTLLDQAPVAGTEPTQTASLDPNVASKPITHDEMAGSWNVNTDNPSCRLIMSFTKWSGGYRAATLRCNSPELSSVTAWDVKNNRVVLVDGQGNQVANISSAGTEAYAGSLVGGKPITLSR